jgi:starvation-inducible outer membrane lipoprotein
MKKYLVLLLCLFITGCVTYSSDINGDREIEKQKKEHNDPKIPEPRPNK